MTSHAPNPAGPAKILRLGSGFCDAKALLTAVDLGLFDVLHQEPATADGLRQRLRLHGRGLRDLLDLLVAHGLLEHADGRYCNALGAERCLVRGGQSYVGGFLEQANRNLYPAWERLTEALRTGKPQAGSNFTEMISDPGRLRQFVEMMDALSNMIGPYLVEAIDWSGVRNVLDVGGARGNLALQIVRAHEHLTVHVFDLPPMGPLFAEYVAAVGIGDRIRFHAGDFFVDPLPLADVLILGHVLHDWDSDQRAKLVAKAYRAVRPGGRLLAYDRMLTDVPSADNLVISLDMLLTTDGGSEYPVTELYEHARAAGFTSVHDQPLGDHDTLVVCRRA